MTACRAAATGSRRAAARSGIRIGDDRPPGVGPASADDGDVGGIGEVPEERRLVEERVPDAGVAPVEQRERRPVAADIARMEVAVDHRVGQAAGRHRGEPGREIGDEGAKRRAVPVAQCVALALDERRDRPGEGRAAPVRQSQAEQLVGPRGPGRLETDEAVDHREPLGERGVVAVVAGHLVEQRPRTVAPEQARDGHGAVRERIEQRPLVREERRNDLEPRRAAGGLEPP